MSETKSGALPSYQASWDHWSRWIIAILDRRAISAEPRADGSAMNVRHTRDRTRYLGATPWRQAQQRATASGGGSQAHDSNRTRTAEKTQTQDLRNQHRTIKSHWRHLWPFVYSRKPTSGFISILNQEPYHSSPRRRDWLNKKQSRESRRQQSAPGNGATYLPNFNVKSSL